MDGLDSVELLAFNLKLIGKKSKKNVLLSAGRVEDKKKLLPAIEKLAGLNLTLFATTGTFKFLSEQGLPCQELVKISDGREPNIRSFLAENRLDLVINILHGNNDYDESTDSNLIRSMAIENGIPLITDTDVAILKIEQLVKRDREGFYRYKIADEKNPWDMKAQFLALVEHYGGFANHHAHFDKAYLISMENIRLSMVDMQKKWALYKHLKENYTLEDLIERISRCVEKMLSQGVTYCRTMVDSDSTVKTLPIEAALEVKRRYKNQLHLEIGVQPLQGVLDPESRTAFVAACRLADFIGGLPSKDRPTPEKHLDIIMDIAKDLNKTLDVHVDQENNPAECETEMLALKTIEHGLQGKVTAVHSISVAAKPPMEQDRIVQLVKDAGISVIVCPSAAIGMRQLEMNAPLHNSIAPVLKLLDSGVNVTIGTDNIYDLFQPLVDGDMWFECRLLMEACRFYDLNRIAEIACRRPVGLPR